MKILYYSPHPTHDIVSEVGYSTHQRETIGAFRELGHEVLPVIMGGTEAKVVQQYHSEITRESGLKSLVRKIMPLFVVNALKDYLLIRHDKKAVQELKKAIAVFKPDLVYERGEYMQNLGVLHCRKSGIKHYLEVNAPAVEEMRSFEGPSLLHWVGLAKEKSKMQNTNQIFAVSTALGEYIKRRYKPEAPVHIIPNCINENKKLPDATEIESIKNKLGIDDRVVIGFVGSIFPHHGVEKLIEAFSRIVGRFPEAFLLIVGDGILRQKLETMAADLLPANSYKFTGKVPHNEVMAYIGNFNVSVMPDSNWYGSPIKIFEYGLMGKIIVAPDYGPLQDVIKNGADGLLTAGDAASMALAFEQILEQPEIHQKMAQAFKNKILNNYTWKKQAAQILST